MLETGEMGVHKWGKYSSGKWRESMLGVVKTESNFQSKWKAQSKLDPKPSSLIYYGLLLKPFCTFLQCVACPLRNWETFINLRWIVQCVACPLRSWTPCNIQI
eukprot:TRINITY_DN2271_c0_g1_i1.p1 TRINITY_DN2271_c0_g1~~TRINITY_DN2271_c0_g1_i1.p1  ORF type:complete len:103 (-),score=2.14 TRINITY_DN2271_c0_g1_i1:1586-1894(-)